MKRPAFMFYPADWRKDTALQSCSLAAQGLWINLMCIAHQCEPYGVLVVNGKVMDALQIARLVGESERRTASMLGELEAAGVFSRTDAGAIYSRRMVKDEHIRTVRAAAGSKAWQDKGGARDRGRFAQAKSGASGDLLEQTDDFAIANSEQTPEQNTALSYSGSPVPPIPPESKGNGKPKRRRQRLPARACPDSFEVTEQMATWAQDRGLPADRVLPETERFLGHHRAKGSMFANWQQAWCNWISKAIEYAAR